MFLSPMRHESPSKSSGRGPDWKGIGYLISIVSVFFLGAIAWPKPGDPAWYLPALIVGMITSIIGMGFRYRAHLQQQKEIEEAEAEARRS
jgi:hypothetical protein